MAGRILVGTCNWSDHLGFYPEGLPRGERLAYYSRFFPLVEVDTTYYGIPPPRTTASWVESTPASFLFNVKAYRSLTYHEREGRDPRDPTAIEESQFNACLVPLRDSGKLRALHYQYPPWFGPSPLNLDRLARLRERHPEDLLIVEMRNRRWAEPERFGQLVDLLSESRVALCVVDEPQLGSGSFPRLVEVTDPRLAAVRFHGRNASTWNIRGQASGDRFNYLYRPNELREWETDIRRLATAAGEVHLLFNNNRSNYAVVNGLQMAEFLELGLPASGLVPPGGREPQVREPQLPFGPRS
ncbi:MAG TPA: DUF72 domain-containing protein [Candidatus Dormibacteraeota bacterium]|nr:DUF72 domain-containing protein [Candidatus Dormibacteraeota bacterium]